MANKIRWYTIVKLGYRTEIDGLRALAIMMVIIYHADQK
jgi:peptidoglycan/LPS O-acetylase OafA/YrhL